MASKTKAAGTTSTTVAIQRLPPELLIVVFIEVLDMAASLKPLGILALVCRRWRDLTSHDHVWSYVARHYYVAYPLIRQFVVAHQSGAAAPSRNAPSKHPDDMLQRAGNRGGVLAATSDFPPDRRRAGHWQSPLMIRVFLANLERAVMNVRHNVDPSAALQEEPRPPVMSDARIVHKRSVSGEVRRPTRQRVIRTHVEMKQHLEQREHAQRVAQRRRYVLHLFVSFNILFLALALVCFAAALEYHGLSAPPQQFLPVFPASAFTSSITASDAADTTLLAQGPEGKTLASGGDVVAELDPQVAPGSALGIPPLTVENGFNFLWATFVLVLATIVANIVMQAHFDPHPLLKRIHRHLELITISTVVIAVCCLSGGIPLYLLQQYCFVTRRERAELNSWLVPLPAVAGAAVWQLHVVFRFRRSLLMWLRGELQLGGRRLYDACANCTPLAIMVCMLSSVAYAETLAHLYLLTGAVIPLVVCGILGVLFSVDFLSGVKFIDGVAAVSLFVACGTPVLLVLGIVRGVSMLPVAAAAIMFFVGHARSLLRLLHTVDELDVLASSGAAEVDDD